MDAQLHADSFPKELQEDLSITNLRKYLKPTMGELWARGKKVASLDLAQPTSDGNNTDDGGSPIDIDTIVTIGKNIWELVVENSVSVTSRRQGIRTFSWESRGESVRACVPGTPLP